MKLPHNKSLDASGGSASRNLLGAAKGALIRAAASTQPLCRFPKIEGCLNVLRSIYETNFNIAAGWRTAVNRNCHLPQLRFGTKKSLPFRLTLKSPWLQLPLAPMAKCISCMSCI